MLRLFASSHGGEPFGLIIPDQAPAASHRSVPDSQMLGNFRRVIFDVEITHIRLISLMPGAASSCPQQNCEPPIRDPLKCQPESVEIL